MISARVRSACVAANRALIGAPSEIPNSAARSAPAASRTAVRSSIRCSSVWGPSIGSERPVPGLSKRSPARTSPAGDSALDRGQLERRLQVGDESRHHDQVDRAVAGERVGDIEPAALGVGDLEIHVVDAVTLLSVGGVPDRFEECGRVDEDLDGNHLRVH